MNYQEFILSKSQGGADSGFDPLFMPDFLFDYQAHIVDWAVRKGRCAILADCGLGKTNMLLSWAQNVVLHTNKRVLILTPLAVGAQLVIEAAQFGFEVGRSRDGTLPREKIVVTNYESLHHFDWKDFVGVVCDESSILKNFNGARKSEITSFMRKVPYRLLDTATAAPNDYIELGTSSEALGYLGYMDMLNKFFKNDLNNSAQGRMRGEVIKWRFKGHAEQPFWRWVCSWARAIRKPSDLGFDDARFELPELIERQHVVEARTLPEGMLFALPAAGLKEQRDERRRTIQERCERASEMVKHDQPALIWCHLNDEGSLIESLVPDAVQVSGSDCDEAKEEKLMAFARGQARVLVTKPKIGAWGLNFQHCNRVVTFPSHSFEQYYQSIRRCWRFGQKRPVEVDIVTTEGESDVLKNLQRKAAQAEKMFSSLVDHMADELSINRVNKLTSKETIPSWL